MSIWFWQYFQTATPCPVCGEKSVAKQMWSAGWPPSFKWDCGHIEVLDMSQTATDERTA